MSFLFRLAWPVFLVSPLAALAQQPLPSTAESATPSPSASPVLFSDATIAEMKRLRDAAMQSDYAFRQVAHLSNNIGPRLTGSFQAQHAVEFVAKELRALGCEVQLSKCMVPHWVRGEERAELVTYPSQAPGTAQKVVLCALGGSVATPPEGLTGEVLVVKDFAELAAIPPSKVAGKIVVYTYAFDKQMAAQGRSGEAYGEAVEYRAEGASAAARKGAVASLIRSVGGADYRLPHTGLLHYADDAPKIPGGAVTAEDAELIAALAAEGPVRMHLVMTPQTLPDVESASVIGDIRGSEHPDQIVVVSGHLDSWDLGTGAIDDGAGVAVSMEAANLVQKLHLKPKRTIRIIAWMAEESGSAGGQAYFRKNQTNVVNHFAAIETDGGAGHPTGINVNVARGARSFFTPVAQVLRAIGAGGINPTEHAGADISLMEKAGVPTFSPIQDGRFYFNYHHTAADTLDKIVPRELQENSAVVATLAYALANLEQPLPR